MPDPTAAPAATDRQPCDGKTPRGKQCPVRAASIIEVGCVNGHRKTVRACTIHSLGVMAGHIGCWECFTGRPRRECALRPVGSAELIDPPEGR